MPECWASILGSCSNKASGEHLVTGGIFNNPDIKVEGFSWCKGTPKIIGINSLTAKILCKKHNSELSPVDDAGIAAFDIFRKMRRVANQREKILPRVIRVIHYSINGLLFERWFLKTLINISFNGEYPIGGSCEKGKPTENLVEIAFGNKSFTGRAGLYSIAKVDQIIESSDIISFSPLIKDNTFIIGGLFSFRGFYFLLFLHPEGPPTHLNGIRFGKENLENAQFNFHNQRIEELQNKKHSQVVEYKW